MYIGVVHFPFTFVGGGKFYVDLYLSFYTEAKANCRRCFLGENAYIKTV